MRFKDKIAVVTGGAVGIGFGIARKLAQEGATIAIVSRNEKRGQEAVENLRSEGLNCSFFRADVTDEDQVVSAITSVIDTFGGLNILVNNAGCGLINSPLENDASASERWAFYQGANLKSSYLMTTHSLENLANRVGSSVINISSTSAHHGNWGLYGVAKSGVEALTRSFAAEAAPLGIRVNCVSPGWIQTSAEQAAKAQGTKEVDWEHPPSLLNRMGQPEEIAGAVCFFASTDASFVTGQTLVVDGGMMVTDYPSLGALNTIGHRGMSRPLSKPSR